MFFNDWFAIYRVLVIGALAYLAVIVLLRFSGKRTLAKWNAFDFIVTIALGSTLATVLLSRQTTLADGVAALALLVLLQFLISWLSQRSPALRRLVKADPVFLYRRGRFMEESLRAERVTHSEVRAAVRGAGIGALEEVEAVVLETDGSVSVVRLTDGRDGSALCDVREHA